MKKLKKTLKIIAIPSILTLNFILNSYNANKYEYSTTSNEVSKELKTHNLESEIHSALNYLNINVYEDNQKTIGTNFYDFYRYIYSDIEDDAVPPRFEETHKKTKEDMKRGKEIRKKLEQKYDLLFELNNVNINKNIEWHEMIQGYYTAPRNSYRKRVHEALDLFTKEGNKVLAPFNGLIIASGDNWEGQFIRREISDWNGKGLTPRAGNALIIYNPLEKGYMLISHLEENIPVSAGQIIFKGQIIGTVGNSGSASIPGHGKHIHVAYKLPNEEGFLRGINFYERLKK